MRELPNRFRCEVEVDGKIHECYQPISFKLGKLMNPVGRKVLLADINKKKSVFEYSVYAIETKEDSYALLNLQMVNSIFQEAINSDTFDYLGKRNISIREKNICGLKTDLFIEDSNTIIEIKTIFSFEQDVLFPNLASQRLLDQIKKINNSICKGYKAILYFAVLTIAPQRIIINSDDLELYTVILDAYRNGLTIKAYRIEQVDGTPKVGEELEVVVEKDSLWIEDNLEN